MNPPRSSCCFGFLTVRRNEAVGYFGGLLTVNAVGRPLEFHCSLPLKPTRAQTILYGASLNDFLVGEQIALALVSKVKTPPRLLLCDLASALTLRNVHPAPLAALLEPPQPAAAGLERPESADRGGLHRFELAGHAMATLSGYREDQRSIEAAWGELAPQVDPREPFARIVEALMEANPAAKAA